MFWLNSFWMKCMLLFRPLPDIDTLLQEWNSEVEDVLGEEGILTPDLDCDLSSYIDIACGNLSIWNNNLFNIQHRYI